MKILHVLDHSIPLHSGYAFRTAAILEQQRALGWETFHLTGSKHTPAGPAEEQIDGLHFYRTPPSTAAWAQWPVAGQIAVIDGLSARLAEVAAALRPDLLHAHSPVLNGIAALRVGRRLGIPVVYEVRAFWEDAAADHGTAREGGLRYRLTRALETYVLRRAAAVTVICEGLRGDVIARGVPAGKVTVIPNAVDVQRFAAGGTPDPTLVQQYGLEGKTVLGFAGSFYAYEGLALLLEAMARIITPLPQVHLVLVGGGPQEGRLMEIAAAMGLDGHVHFTGRVPHDRVQAYYGLMDIMVYPRQSIRLTELVTPLKPLEAMAQRKLVIASDVGGHRELIRHGETGYLFHAGDAAALAATVVQAVRERTQWPRLHEAGHRYVSSERTWAASVGRYRPIYEGLAGADPR